jgi:hypothetical protein
MASLQCILTPTADCKGLRPFGADLVLVDRRLVEILDEWVVPDMTLENFLNRHTLRHVVSKRPASTLR